jgi:mannitol/fructose-specific phosphotransferase system IIA component (Ntr-type)/galactitol-specific phosphotransferase system IIB component
LSEIDTEEIIQNFAYEYEITQRVLNELKFFTNHNADKDEIALITLHFKAAMNRYHSTHNKQLKVLIVCSQGYGTSRLLEQQLNEVYSVDIAECIPSHFLPFYENLADIDLVVTTIKELTLEQPIPMIYVKPILSSDDFKKLDEVLVSRKSQILLSELTQIIDEHAHINDRKKMVDHLISRFGNTLINDLESPNINLMKFLSIDNVLIIEEKIDWQTAISLCGDMLVTNGYVNELYVESMIEAFENYGSYMVIDEGVAIPHAKNEDNVFQTGIVLTICKHPVIFNGDHHISSFFAFCSADHHEHLDALVAISNLISETDFKNLIATFNDEHEVIAYIRDFALRN